MILDDKKDIKKIHDLAATIAVTILAGESIGTQLSVIMILAAAVLDDEGVDDEQVEAFITVFSRSINKEIRFAKKKARLNGLKIDNLT